MQERCFTELLRLALRQRIALILLLISTAVSITDRAQASTDSSIKLSTDFPYFTGNKKLVQDFHFSVQQGSRGLLTFSCYLFTSQQDSVFVLGRKDVPLKIKAGISSQEVKFGHNDAASYVHPVLFNILRKAGTVPAGSYKYYIQFKSDSGVVYNNTLILLADSTLPSTSRLSKGISNKIDPEKEASFWSRPAKAAKSLIPASKSLDNHALGINRLFKSKGLTSAIEHRANKSCVNLWYEDWFVGRYELDGASNAASQIQARKAQLSSNISSQASNELENYRSLFSQVRELAKSEKEDNELKGELALSGNWSSAQPEYSAQDNNFYEVRGRTETELADVPLSIEGYYTTQDRDRQVKASYIRFHYDAQRAKSKLMKLITGYKSQFNQTVAKGKGLEQVYGSYLSNLESSKARMLVDLKREAGIPAYDGKAIDTSALRGQIESVIAQKMQDTAALQNNAEGKLDSAGKVKRAQQNAARVKDSAMWAYAQAMKRYEQIQKTQAQIDKYRALLEQYKNTTYFDSALAYSKVKNLQNAEQVTYKQMAKSAAGLLPEGKAKTFVAGLTNLDAGIINKYSSKYTAAGQQLTGLDVGYDIGFAQVGLTVGKTEYAGRNGTLNKYTTYSGSMQFSPAKGQKASLIYYGYTPSRSMLRNDAFFRNAGLALPTFREPVHIVSATYEGTIAKAVNIEAEAATSYRNGSDKSFISSFDADRIAWHLNAEGQIPRMPLSLVGSYEHGGKEFQNSTMPVMIAGTDLYKVGAKGEFFRSFLTAKVEFNHMQQSNFYATGGNNRWGFEIATRSKQYPSVSLSYKPFATFRTLTDTLAVPQRPLQGAVWTGKASYQIKRKGGVSYRFSAVFNRSTSHTDSVKYGADLLQLNAIYSDKQWMLMLSTGQSMLQTSTGGFSTDSLNPAHVRTTFAMGSLGYNFSTDLSASGGADIGFAPFGLSRYGINGGLNYRMKSAPLTVRVMGQYGAYRLADYSGPIGSDLKGSNQHEPMQWRHLVSGSLEFIWQFRMKLND